MQSILLHLIAITMIYQWENLEHSMCFLLEILEKVYALLEHCKNNLCNMILLQLL